MTCPDCGFLMDALDSECSRCKIQKQNKPTGSVKTQLLPASDPAATSLPLPKPTRCIKCGTQVSPTTKFCPECGDHLQPGSPRAVGLASNDHTPPPSTLLPSAPVTPANTSTVPANALNPSLSPSQVFGCLALFVVLFLLPFSCNLSTPGSSGGGITVSPAGIGSTVVTLDEYTRCAIGMTVDECEQIIGAPGVENSRVESAELGLVIVGIQWVNPDGSNMQAQFQNGKLSTKAQAGLD